MSDLLSLLSLGSAGIAAQNAGVSVATNNVANVNTRGYSRERVDLESLLQGGVRAGDPQRIGDELLAGRIRTAGGALAMAKAFAQALSDVEARLTDGGPTIDEHLAQLFSRTSQLAAAPTDGTSRAAVLDAARDLVAGIRRRSAELSAARDEANQRIASNAEEAAELAKTLAQTNLQIARTNDPALHDQRDRIANQLSELVGGSARIDSDGRMRFVLDGGAVLVDGDQAASITATPDPTTGDMRVSVGARDVTTQIGGGAIGGDLAMRDRELTDAQGALDQLAFDVTSQFNSVHTANAGLDGVSGRPMFVAQAQVAGAASRMALDPALDADPSKLAAAAPGAGPGDNRGALALLGLTKLGDQALSIVSRIGTAAARANGDVTAGQLVSDHLSSLRESLAGVDIQEELANLSRFEHASAAMTKFVSTIDDMLGALIDRL
jgi:flagellar hook-associated protein 1